MQSTPQKFQLLNLKLALCANNKANLRVNSAPFQVKYSCKHFTMLFDVFYLDLRLFCTK